MFGIIHQLIQGITNMRISTRFGYGVRLKQEQCITDIIVPCHSFSSSVPYILLCPVIHFLPVFHTYYCALSFIFFQCSIHFYVTAWPYLNSTNIFIMIIKHWWWFQDFRGWVNTYLSLVWAWWKHLCSSKHEINSTIVWS